jgi:hypothetical protein
MKTYNIYKTIDSRMMLGWNLQGSEEINQVRFGVVLEAGDEKSV